MEGTGSDFGHSSGFSEEKLDAVSAGFKDGNIRGEGASCIVYKLRHGDLLVAVKRLRRELINGAEYRSSYRKEFRIGQNLKHNALPVYRELRDDLDEVYIVMDYVDGISVEDFIETTDGKEYFKSADNVRRFLTELVDVVVYLHRSGVIHCDLKPANIMLRHSDRGVMLLDLDKAYSDTLSANHGGTKSFSDPLGKDQKPTAAKDFRAIGKILDKIAEAVLEFPSSKFRRFRKECDDRNASGKVLLATLQPKNPTRYLVLTGSLLAALTIAFFVSKNFTSDSSSNISADDPASSATPVSEVPAKDTVVIVAQPQPEQVPADSPKEKKEKPIVDIDKEMAHFIVEVKAAQKALEEGISPEDLIELNTNLNWSYLNTYSKIVNDCKSRNPDRPALDVELDVARIWESSQACKLYTHYNKVLSDTLNQRERAKELHQ